MKKQTSFFTLNRNQVLFHVQLVRMGKVFVLLAYLLSSVTTVGALVNTIQFSNTPALYPAFNAAALTQTTVTFQEGVSGYSGTIDTFIRQPEPAIEFSTNTGLEWDGEVTSGQGDDEVAMIRFENIFGSAAGQIPAGAVIISSNLKYRVSNVTSSEGDSANVYESLVSWTENVTWNTFGGEAGAQADEYSNLAITAPATVANTEYTINVTASLQRWLNNPSTNLGWIFVPTANNGVILFSSESSTVANRPYLEVTYTTGGPNQPILVQPANGATGISASANLEVGVSDPDGDDLSVTFYGRPVNDGEDFTIIAMPDTQHYVDGVGDAANFAAQTQWIVDNKDARNIVFVTGLGDIVQNGNTNDSEWQIANNAYTLIENPLTTLLADGIPYGLAVGNHDQSPIGGGNTASTTKYNQYFGVPRFNGRVYYGGHYGSDNDNNYELFSAGGMDFIIIHFEYDTTPEQVVLDWADNLLTTHADRRAILTTHYMINEGNPGSWGAQGQAIFTALSDHPNVFLMLGGHIHGEGKRQDTAVNGNVVYTVLSDYQDLPNGGNGFLRIMQFSPANDTITISTYSPPLNQYGTSTVMGADTTSAQFILPYTMGGSEPFVELGMLSNVESGANISMPWTGLSNDTEYEWYVTVDDGTAVATGATWSFTTMGTSPTPTSTATHTPMSTFTRTPTVTATPTLTVTSTLTKTPTNTSTYTPTNTPTQTSTNTATRTPTITATSTRTSTVTFTVTSTNTPTATLTQTATNTLTKTPTITSTSTPTLTPTHTLTPTQTSTTTFTATFTKTPTPTYTITNTSTNTATATRTSTVTPTVAPTNTPTRTPTNTATATPIADMPPIVTSITRANPSPTTNATSVDFTVMFSESVTGVDTADFKLTNTILTGASVTDVTGTGSGPYTVVVNTGTGNGTIRLDVPATATIQDLEGNYFFNPYTSGETYTVYKGAAPTVPVLVSPANNALVTSYQPTLDWNNSSEVMALTVPSWHYEINVTSPAGYNLTDNTVDNADPLVGLGASQYIFTAPLPANTTFTWKVRAYNDANQYSAWSATRTFRTMLATPVLISPVDDPNSLTPLDNKRPTFEWSAVPGATSYTLQILKGTTVVVTGTITAPLHVYTPAAELLPSTTYTWKVKANGTNAGVYSDPFTFTTSSNPPKVPVLTLPANAALVDGALEVILKWNHVPAVTTTVPATTYPAAASFQVEYATNSAFTDSIVEIVNWNMLPEPQQLSLSIGTLAPNLTYSWRVRSWSGTDAAGNHSLWSAARTFRTKPPSTKLDAPTLNLPADSVTLNNKRPTFSWSEVPGVTTYTLQILKGTTVVVTGTIKPPLHTYTPAADLLPNTTYTWKVKANGLVSSDYSAPSTFTTSLNTPNVPVLFAPAVNALVDSAVQQTLDWNPVLAVVTTNPATSYPAAVSYDVEYATNSTFVSSTLVNVAAPDTQYLIPSLLPANTTFYWRVRASNITGQYSAWSATRIFKTRLATPILNLPANGSSLNNKRPTFEWDEVSGATTYTLQILKENPTTHLFTVAAHTGTIKPPAYTYIPTVDLLPNATYQWQVKANGVNAGIYSAPFTFTTSANPPAVPVLFAPANAALLANNAAQILDWNASLGAPAAGSYEIEYANNSTFTGATFVTNTTLATTTQLSIVTLPGRTYYWRVRSWSGAGATGNHSAWSVVRTINVKFVAPTLTTPIAGATVGVRPTFTWDSTNGLWTSYTLQVANNSAFTLGLRSFTITAPTTTYTIPNTLPALTSGTKYWRVKINGLYTPIFSAYQSFIVP